MGKHITANLWWNGNFGFGFKFTAKKCIKQLDITCDSNISCYRNDFMQYVFHI